MVAAVRIHSLPVQESTDGRCYRTQALPDRPDRRTVGDCRAPCSSRQAWWYTAKSEHARGSQYVFLSQSDGLSVAYAAARFAAQEHRLRVFQPVAPRWDLATLRGCAAPTSAARRRL